jgi:hypothetical protein
MKTKFHDYIEARLYIGSRSGYDGQFFTLHELAKKIQTYQKEVGDPKTDDLTPVRITPTNYVAGDYMEAGWEVAVIAYPRRPKSQKQLYEFIDGLAAYLLNEFKQNRISIVSIDRCKMIESDTAQEFTEKQKSLKSQV